MPSILHGSNSCARRRDEYRQNVTPRATAMACNFDMPVPLGGNHFILHRINQELRGLGMITSVNVVTSDLKPTMQVIVLRSRFLFHRRPDQFAPAERTEVYLNTILSHRNVPILLVQDKETRSSFVGYPHKPKTALGMAELL